MAETAFYTMLSMAYVKPKTEDRLKLRNDPSYRRSCCACGVDIRRCELPSGDECATVLTAEKVRCSPASPCSRATGRAARGCGWLCSSHLLRCAPRPGRCQVGTGKQARRSNRKAGFVRSPPGRQCRAPD